MADVTVYKPAGVTVTVLDGVPPVDQSAEVALLTTDLATRTAERDALQVSLNAANVLTAALQTKIANATAALA
jgi:hypothetical protein